jgi:hypothetical protein
MKYILVLKEKKYKKEDLPKTVQKKIAAVEALQAEAKEFEGIKHLNESESDTLKRINQRLEILDKELMKSINKFNPAVYKRKLEVMDEVRVKRYPNKPTTASQDKVRLKRLEKGAEVLPEADLTPREIAVEPPLLETEEVNELAEEFEKTATATPKKTSKGLILMGIGFFFMTWGAVNFFKERRGNG